jgi:hypothetical protein
MSMRLLAAGVAAGWFALAGYASGAPPRQAWMGPAHVDTTVKPIHLRKVARKILGMGEEKRDEVPLLLGPVRARVWWRKGWKWNESSLDTRLPHGMQGGPMLSLDLPLAPSHVLSLETQLCALRYVFAKSSSSRLLSDELIDPQRRRQSLEAGLYLNVSFGSR